MYVPLHARSAYSLGRGTSPVKDLVAEAARYGHDAIALTDRNNLYGLLPFIAACREAGVKPIPGAEVDGPEGLAVLLARDATGYANLCRLVTRRMLDPGFRLVAALKELHPGLHVLAANDRLLEHLARVIPRGSLWAELAAPLQGSSAYARTAATAERLRIPLVGTGDVMCLRREDRRLHALLTAIRENTMVARLTAEDLAHPEAYFKAPPAIVSVFRDRRDALRNTRAIAESCTYVPSRTRWIFPDPPLPQGETAVSRLKALCEAGMIRRYGRRTQPASERLDRELLVIERLGFSPYFVVVGEVVAHARGLGIATVGRGSGASALTAYLLGITNVDPIRYGLTFERFLHEKREDCPDLDVDLCWIRRDEVIEHVYETYGRDRVAMISTHAAFQPRSAFREAARAHGIAASRVNRLSRCVPSRVEGSLRAALDAAPRGREIPRDELPWPRILDEADRLLGLPRHLGLHPGGIVISDRPLDGYVPLEEATKGILCTQFEMRAIEAVGLVKIDLLGNRALSTIQEAVELIAERHGERLDPDAFPHDDRAAAKLLAEGDTLGVFQMESPAMRNLNRMLRTPDLATSIAAVALIRPGPAASGMKERYCLRARGKEAAAYADPRLEPLLCETHGVLLYEEDVIRVASLVAGIPLEDGDVLRRAIAATGRDDREDLGRVFLERAQSRGYALEAARAIWEGLLRFGAFAFCKAHAAGYGVLAWQAGWLKAHYPLEFAVGIMNHHAGMYDKRTHLEDAKRRGVRVLLPDVNRSEPAFTADSDALRIGLGQVQGLTEALQRRLLAARSRRPFASLEDLLSRVRPSRPEAEALILSGALDDTGRTRPELLCVLASAFALFEKRGPGADDLFTGEAPVRAPWPIPCLPEFTEEERAWQEWRVLGLCAGKHPMVFFRERGLPEGVLCARDAERQAGRRIRTAGLVAARRTTPTREGRDMQFVTLEDETGLVECTFFPDAFARHRGLVRDLGPYLVEGRVGEQLGAPGVRVERAARLDVAVHEPLLVR